MPTRPRKTPVKPAKSPRAPAKSSDATLADLMERGDRIRKTSGHLIRQMRDLAAELAEDKARAEDWRRGNKEEQSGWKTKT